MMMARGLVLAAACYINNAFQYIAERVCKNKQPRATIKVIMLPLTIIFDYTTISNFLNYNNNIIYRNIPRDSNKHPSLASGSQWAITSHPTPINTIIFIKGSTSEYIPRSS